MLDKEPIPPLYRKKWMAILAIVLVFGLLIFLCWYWYHNQLEELEKSIQKHQNLRL